MPPVQRSRTRCPLTATMPDAAGEGSTYAEAIPGTTQGRPHGLRWRHGHPTLRTWHLPEPCVREHQPHAPRSRARDPPGLCPGGCGDHRDQLLRGQPRASHRQGPGGRGGQHQPAGRPARSRSGGRRAVPGRIRGPQRTDTHHPDRSRAPAPGGGLLRAMQPPGRGRRRPVHAGDLPPGERAPDRPQGRASRRGPRLPHRGHGGLRRRRPLGRRRHAGASRGAAGGMGSRRSRRQLRGRPADRLPRGRAHGGPWHSHLCPAQRRLSSAHRRPHGLHVHAGVLRRVRQAHVPDRRVHRGWLLWHRPRSHPLDVECRPHAQWRPRPHLCRAEDGDAGGPRGIRTHPDRREDVILRQG